MVHELECGSGESLGSLGSCLVEGDAEFEYHASRLRRRALILSILFQSVIVAALIISPLFSEGQRIFLKDMTPLPPYTFSGGHTRNSNGQPHPPKAPPACRFCPPPSIPQTIATRVENTGGDSQEPTGPVIPGLPPGASVPGGLASTESTRGPEPPPPGQERARIVVGHIEPAMLTHRVEPVYPQLARQLQREGRVELRAIISTDGSVQSLEVISGDPLLIQSALTAVRAWRYRPTILNGKPVEVDTHITVIYSFTR